MEANFKHNALQAVCHRRVPLLVLLCVAMIAMLALPSPLSAAPAGGERCYAGADDTALLTARLKRDGGAGLHWDCRTSSPSIAPRAVAVRLPVPKEQNAQALKYLVARQGLFETLTLIAVDRNGTARERRYSAHRVRAETVDSKFSAALPEMKANTEAVFAVFGHPRSAATLQLTFLSAKRPSISGNSMKVLLLVALLCGFLLMPVFFDIVFYRALKETFALWHAATAALLSIHLATSGIVLFVIPLDVPTLTNFATVSFSFLLVTAFMFARAIIEPGMLHPVLRQGLAGCAIIAMALMVLRIIPLEMTRSWSLSAYFAGHGPILLYLVVCAVDAWRRGSRAVKFLTVGWAPFIILGIIRIVTYLTPIGSPEDAVWLFRFAAVLEIVVTSIAVADRFANLRRQRDTALEEASRMVTVAELDQLTGLRNRRALKARFDDLRFKGFDTFALLDLDQFKLVNDTHGHTIGDEVLAAVGAALEDHPDRDVRAFRLGGEEFVLLLRGKHSLQRAEALRQMIPGQIAARVKGLSAPVTSSMGLVRVPREGLSSMQLRDLYSRADKLLYDAKAGGRNRTASERLSVFSPSLERGGKTAPVRRAYRGGAAA